MPKITLPVDALRAVRRWITTTLVALAGVLGLSAPGQAQVSSYGYSVSFGTYFPLRSGTAITPNSGGGSLNDGYSTPIPLPFTFDYGGVQVDKVVLSTNGYVALGSHRVTNNYNILKGASDNLIGFANTNLTTDIAGGQYSYTVSGTTPNRIFVLQARQFQLSDNTPAKTGNAQVWLYETTNVVEIHYGAFGTGWGTAVTAVIPDTVRVGLRGAGITDLAAVTGTWTASTATNNPRVGMPLLQRTVLPTSGQILRFAPTCNVPTPVVTTNSPVCQGSTLTLSTTGFAPTATYSWTGPNGFTASSAAISIPNATPTDAGLYTVVVTVGGCQSGRGTTFASVNPTFTPDPDFESRCGPGPVTFTTNGPVQFGGYSYRWYTQAQGGTPIPGATTNTYTTPSLNADATYYATVVMPTSAGGCEGPRVPMTATINPLPAADLIPVGSTTLCAGDSVVLRAFPRGLISSARPMGGNFSAYGYTYFLNGQPLSEFADSLIVTVGGTYTVEVSDFSTECSATSGPVTVTVAAPVSAAFDYSSRLYCQNTLPLPVPTISGSSGGTFSVSPATGLIVNPTTGRLTLATATPGQYQITYSVGGTCPASATRSVFVLAAPIATFSYQPTGPVCAGGSGTIPAVLAQGATAGVFSASPSTGLALNSQNGAIFLGNSQPGTYIVTNTIGAGNVCPQVTATTSITIGTTPTAGISAGGPLSFCQGGSVTLTATGGGPNATFVWSNGATTSSIVATTGGSYTVTVTNATGCTATSPATTVTVFPQTSASFTYAGQTFCQTTTASTTPTISGTPGGVFSATPTGLSLNAQTGQFAAGASAPGTYTVTYSVSSRTCPSSSSKTIIIEAAPTAVFGYSGPGPFCAGASGTLAPAMAPGAVKGTFTVSPTGLTVDSQSGVLALASAQAGTYVVTNSVAASNGCAATSDTAEVTITPRPGANVSANGPTTFCVGGSVTLSVAAFSGAQFLWSTGATSQSIVVTTTGSYTVTVTNRQGCSTTSTPTSVTVNPLATATFSYGAATFCAGGAPNPTPTITGTSGGTFSAVPTGLAINAQTGQINLSASQAGAYRITYSVGGLCPASSTVSIQLNAAPSAAFFYSPDLSPCAGGSIVVSPIADDDAVLGTFTATPTGLTLDAQTGAINLATSVAGSYTVTNTVAAANGCPAVSATTVFVVRPTPTAGISAGGPTSFCAGGSVVLTATGGGPNATFGWSTGATSASITVTTGGPYSVVVTNGAGCSATSATTTVTILSPPSAAFAYASSTFCLTGANPTPTITGASGGTFTAQPSGLSLNAQSGVINLAASQPGSYRVTYTVGGPSCPAATTQSITITTAPLAAFTYPLDGKRCAGASGQLTPVFGQGASAGTFSATPTGLSLNTQSGIIDLATSSAGLFTITNTIAAANGCAASTATASVFIEPTPTAGISAGGPLTFCQGGSVTLTATGGGPNAQFLWSTGATTPSITVTQSASVTVTVTNAAGCGKSSAPAVVTVNPQPSALFAYRASSFCLTGANPSPTISGASGGTFSATPTGLSLNAQTGVVDLSGSQPGTYTVTYAVGGVCPASHSVSLTITTAPIATFSYSTNGPACAGATGSLAPVLANGATAGTFSATPSGLDLNAGTGVISLAGSAPGTYSVTNTLVAGNGCAATSATTSVVINALPQASIAHTGPLVFCAGGSVTLTANGGTTYLWNTGATSPSITVTQSGTFSVTATNQAGCSATSAPITVTVNPQATATFAYGAPTYCLGGAPNPAPTITGTSGGTFTASPTGISLNPQTGQISLSGSQAGAYRITYSVGGLCPASSTQTVTLNAAPSAAFFYSPDLSPCAGGSIVVSPMADDDAVLGTFTATPTGLTLDAQTGAINLATSVAGSYTVTNTVAAANGCPAVSATTVFVVRPTPTAGISASGPTSFCAGGSVVLTATGGGPNATFGWSTGATSSSITVTTGGPYSVVVTNGAGCSATSATTTVTVTPQASAAFTYSGRSFCRSGQNPVASITGNTGGTFSATPAGLTLDAQTGTITLATSQPGTYTVTYAVGGTCPASATQTVVINAAPTTGFSYSGTGGTGGNCAGTSGTLTPTFSTGATVGTFSATPAGLSLNTQTGVINLAASQPGTYTVTNAIAAGNGCAATSATASVVINATPTAGISAGGPLTFCQGGSVTLTATGGGPNAQFLWSTGATSPSITVTQSAAVTVTVTNAAGCSTTSVTTTVTVNPQPSAAFAYAGSTFCLTGTDPVPSLTGSTGGTFSATPTGLSLNPQTGAISLAASQPGTYIVTYAISGTTCPASQTQTITITGAPLATFQYPASTGGNGGLCTGTTGTVVPTFGNGASAGTFSATPAGLTLNPNSGVINLATSQPGTYTVTNAIAAGNGCAAASASATVTINARPTASISAGGPTTFCQGGSVTLTAGTANGYLWSTGSTDPSITVSTSMQVSVTVTNAAGCSATSAPLTVTVNPQASAAFAYGASSYCVSGAVDPTPVISGTTGGTFSSSPLGLTLDGQTGTIILGASAPGSYTVTYAVTGACGARQSQQIVIQSAPTAGFSYPVTVSHCAGTASSLTPTLSAGASAGTFSATPSGLSLSAQTGVITLATSQPGTYTVTNAIAASNGCAAASAVATVVINAAPTASISAGGPLAFCQGGSVTLTASGGTSYVWSNGATSASITVTQSGQFSVVATNAAGCSATSATTTVTVNPQASAAFAYSTSTFCVSGSNPVPTITGSTGGTFTSSPSGLSLNPQTGEINLAGSSAGTYAVTYAVGGTCPATFTQTVTLTTAPLASFSYSGTGGTGGNCAGTSGTLTPTFSTGASAGAFSATPAGLSLSAQTGVINLATSQPGTYTVTNAIAAGNGCAVASAVATVVINAAPTASISAGGPLTFCQGSSVVLTASGGTSYVWSNGATAASITVTQSGQFSVVATNAAGCSATSATTTVTVNPQASAAFAYSTSTFCVSGSNPVPTVSGSTGGTFSSTPVGLAVNPQTGEINLAGSSAGTYAVTYAVGGTCPAAFTQTVTLTTAPLAAFSYVGTGGSGGNCAGTSGTLTPTFSTGASAGAFSATPAGLTLNATSGVINLATSQPGTYTVTNAIAASNGCAAASAVATVVINAAPTASISANGPTTFCQGGSLVLTASGGTSYVWSNGATAASITVTQSGQFSVVATNAAGCSATSATTTVTVTPQASAAFAYSTSSFCVSGSNPMPTVSGTTGGTFSSTPVGLAVNPQTGEINLASSSAGTYAVTYAVGGTCPAAFTQTVTLTTAPLASFSYSGTGGTGGNCAGTSGTLTPTFSTGASAGTFSATPLGLSLNATSGVINLAASQPGTYTVTNAIAAGNGCAAASAVATVVINAAPTASISAGGPLTFCQGGSVTLTASGGTSYVWSNGATSPSITVTQSGQFSVVATNAAGCSATSATTTVTVTPQASAAFAYSTSTFCVSGSNPVPTVSGTTGGTFSATPAGLSVNTQTGEINLAGSSAGTYAVTYAVGGSCPAAFTQTVTLTTAPSASFSYVGNGGSGSFCLGSNSTVVPVLAPGASAGNFLASPSGLAINHQTGELLLNNSALGTYTVTNTLPANGGCAAVTASFTVEINALPIAAFTANGPLTFCEGGSVTLTASGGASYAWSNGATTASITVTQSGSFYVVATNAAGCSDTSIVRTVTVNPQASAAFTYGGTDFCVSAPNPTPTVTGTLGGFFTATPGGISLNPQTGTINLAASQAGTYTVTYLVGGACPAAQTQVVTISAAPNAVFSYAASGSRCVGTAGVLLPTLASGTSAGTFSATPAGLTLNATTGAVDLATSQPGAYTVSHTVGANGACAAATATTALTLFATPAATITSGGPLTFCQGGSVVLTASGGSSYLWSNGATTPSITVTQGGTFSVTAQNAGGCSAVSSQTTVVVNPQASAAFSFGASGYCAGSGTNPTPTVTGTPGGTFSAAPAGLAINAATGALTLTASAPGTYTVTYAVGGPCGASQTQQLTISAAPQATFAYTSPIGCSGTPGTLAPVLAPGSTAGVFSVTPSGLAMNLTTGVINLAATAPGTYVIRNTIRAAGGCSAVVATTTMTILALPTVAITNLGLTYCSLHGPVTLTGTVNGQTAPGIFTIDGQPASVFDPGSLGAGPHVVAFTGTVGGACDATVSTTVTVIASPTQPVITVQTLPSGLVQLTSSQPTGNQWYLNGSPIPGATGPTYTASAATQNGSYTVVCTVAGCPSAPSAPQLVQITGIVEGPGAPINVALYPVPTLDGYVTLETPFVGRKAEVVVYDIAGRCVWRTTLTHGNGTAGTVATRHTLDLRDLPVGTYLLRLTTTDGTATRRLVRE